MVDKDFRFYDDEDAFYEIREEDIWKEEELAEAEAYRRRIERRIGVGPGYHPPYDDDDEEESVADRLIKEGPPLQKREVGISVYWWPAKKEGDTALLPDGERKGREPAPPVSVIDKEKGELTTTVHADGKTWRIVRRLRGRTPERSGVLWKVFVEIGGSIIDRGPEA